MSAGGRTTWWGKDAAWHRRELIVELGEEFGAEGPNVMDVLSSWAQEQRGGGEVRGGFRTLSREGFVTVSHAQSIVERATEIGALDDLEIDPDGRRFKCRVSGWHSDQTRARAAARQAAKRNLDGESSEPTVTDRDMSRPVTQKPPPNHITTTNPPTPLTQKPEFVEWLADHEHVTGHASPKPGTKALSSLAESFQARRAEGYSVDDLKLASNGAHADEYRREHGYDTADSVLRPTKVASLIAKGKLRTRPGAALAPADQNAALSRAFRPNGGAA